MSATNDLFDGLAALLVAANVGVTRNAPAKFLSTDTAIVMETLPQAPDTAVCLTIYPVTDDPTLSDSVAGVQVKTRAAGSDPRPLNSLNDSVFAAFQNFTGALPNGVYVVQMLRKSGVPLGKDDNQRRLRSENYYVKFWRPSTYRE